MAYLQIAFPLVMALISWIVPQSRRPWLLPFTATAHLAMTTLVLANPVLNVTGPWLALDALGRFILPAVGTLYLVCSFYSVGYLHYRREWSNRVFCACFLAFPGVLSLVTWSQHLGLMWVGMEATTLVTAPLIYFNNNRRCLEATWKYLLVCSIGIALALLGTFFLAYASLHGGFEPTLTLEVLLSNAPLLSKPWLHAAFVLLLVGYGTKMGLAPMHTWKPDAYGEAPGVVGAILAGGVTSCAFLALLRVWHICHAAGEDAFTSRLLLFMGLFSMAVAGVLMVCQRDIKRLLAYSSVEHMGILALGLGIGPAALFGTLLHVLTNGLTKGVLFLAAGNINLSFGSKNIEHVCGAMRRLPLSGGLFLAGFIAITGSPPFAPFISEFAILNGAIDSGHFAVGGIFLVFLLVVFIGMGTTVLNAVQGAPADGSVGTPYRDTPMTGAPILFLMGLVLLLGFWIPGPLLKILNDAVQFLEGSA